jgi:hypothetical protein
MNDRTGNLPPLPGIALRCVLRWLSSWAQWHAPSAILLYYWMARWAYARTETAVTFIIPELPGECAEALFIAMAALVPTAGKQITTDQGSCRVSRESARETRRRNRSVL